MLILITNIIFPTSAGGIGVLLNIDRLVRRIRRKLNRKVFINGIVDSAWFLDYPAYRQSNCTHIYECPPENAVRKGMKYDRILGF